MNEISEAMAIAGARSIGNTAGETNQLVRSRLCYEAMERARITGKNEESIPTGQPDRIENGEVIIDGRVVGHQG